MSKSLTACFSGADENGAVGRTGIVAGIVRELSGADVKPGLARKGSQAKNAKQKVAEWL